MSFMNSETRIQTIEYHRELKKVTEELRSKKSILKELRALAFIIDGVTIN